MAYFSNNRITNSMMAGNYLSGMKTNLNNLQTINNQLTTGKSVSKPSDDPYKVARSMQLNTDINANKQYDENIKDTTNFLSSTDTTLGQVTSIMQRIRELMVSSGNAAYKSSERGAISDEVNQRVEELGEVLNTNFDGKYIFGGTKTGSKPIGITTDPSTGQKGLMYIDKEGNELSPLSTDTNVQNQLKMIGTNLNVEVSQGVKMNYSVTANDVLSFKDASGNPVDMMKLLTDITTNLNSSDPTASSKVTNENLSGVDSVVTNLLKLRAEVGAKENRMDSAQTRNEDENSNMTEILSKTEDIDFTEKTIQYSMAQTVYSAALQVSAKVLPKTLMDYL